MPKVHACDGLWRRPCSILFNIVAGSVAGCFVFVCALSFALFLFFSGAVVLAATAVAWLVLGSGGATVDAA